MLGEITYTINLHKKENSDLKKNQSVKNKNETNFQIHYWTDP